MFGYRQPLRLEDSPIPEIRADEVLVKVGAAGMCRTDFQLLDGYFRSSLPLEFPATPGHEIAGWIDRMGRDVPSPQWRDTCPPHTPTSKRATSRPCSSGSIAGAPEPAGSSTCSHPRPDGPSSAT